MRRVIFLGILIIVGVFFVKQHSEKRNIPLISVKSIPTTVKTSPQIPQFSPITSKALFVPYWNTQGTIPSEYNKVIYFGIAGGKEGILNDTGYQNISTFQKMVHNGQKQYLTLRLLNADDNLEILENKTLQQQIISKTKEIAGSYGFEGVVIDLELATLPLDDVTEKINTFIAYADNQFEANNLETLIVLYGDVFYRARPYDVGFINEHSDEILVMAYDFSKSYGEPGPNFPLSGRETYGYDFQTMIDDYKKVVPAEKLTVIFGMYGWNWAIGPEGKPLQRATAMSLQDITSSYIDTCQFTYCSITSNALSAESKVIYTDKQGKNHEVWFENEDSVRKKTEFLQHQGIQSIGKWVWGYF